MDKIKIGIVEDNPKLGKDIREKLALGEGVAVLWEVRDGNDALMALAAGEVPDVVLMDIVMPGMNGIEATRRAKQLYPDLRIVMLTVADDEQKLFEALQAGASGYLLKEVKPHHLLHAVEEVLEGGLPLSPALACRILRYLKEVNPAPPPPAANYGLTKQEKKILECLKQGMPVKHIADNLFIAPTTVRKHLENIYRKLQVHSATEAVAVAQGYQQRE